MKHLTLSLLPLSAAGLALTTLAAGAQSLPDGFELKGVIEYEYLDSDGSDEDVLYGDIDFAIRPGSFATGVPIGFGLGIEAIHVDSSTETAIYPVLTFDTGMGVISAGIPRPVNPDYLRTPVFAGNRLLDLEARILSGSFVELAYLIGDETPYGLRYDGEFGAFSIGASYHDFHDADAEALDLALRYEQGDFAVMAAVERLDGAGDSSTSYSIGAEGRIGRLKGGLVYSSVEVMGDADVLHGYLTYTPLDRLDLTLSALHADSGGGDSTIYGLSADYTFYRGAYVQAGYVDSDESGFDGILDLSLGWRF